MEQPTFNLNKEDKMDLKNIIRNLIVSMDEDDNPQIERYATSLCDYLKTSSDLREDLLSDNEVYEVLCTNTIGDLGLGSNSVTRDDENCLRMYLAQRITPILFFGFIQKSTDEYMKALALVHNAVSKFIPSALDTQLNPINDASLDSNERSPGFFWLVVDYMKEHPGKTIGGMIVGSLLVAGIIGIALGSCGVGILGLGALGTLVASVTTATSALIGLGFFAVSADLAPVDVSKALFLYH